MALSDDRRRAELIKSRAKSAARIIDDRKSVAQSLASTRTRDSLKKVVKPNSISKTLRKAGVAMLLAPDPVTAVPGAVMLGASLATKKKEPLTPKSVYEEANKLLDEMGSL